MEDFLASAREADDVHQVHFDQLEALLRRVTSAEEMREVLYSCIDAYSSNGDGGSNMSAYQQAILRAIAVVLEYAQHYSHTSVTAAVVTSGQHTASVTPVALNTSTSRMMLLPPPCYGVRYARLLHSTASQPDSTDMSSVQRGADTMTNDSIQHRQQQRCWRLSLEDCLTLTLFFNELATLSEVRSFEYLCAAIATLFELCAPRVFAPLRGSQVDYSGVAVQGTSQSGQDMRTACHSNDEHDAAEEVNRTALRTELNALRVMLTRRLTTGNNSNSGGASVVAQQSQRGSGKTSNSNSGSCRLHLIALDCVTRMLWSLLRCVAPDTRLVALMHADPQGTTLPSHATKANDNVCHVVAGETAWDEQVSGAVQEILLAHMHDLLAPLRQAIDEQQQQQAVNTSAAAAAGGGTSLEQQGNSHSALGTASHSSPLLLTQLLHHIEHTLWLCQQLCAAASTALPPSLRTAATTNGGSAEEGVVEKKEEEVVGEEKDTQGDGTGVAIVKAVYRHTVSGVLTLLQKYLTLQQQLQRQKLTLGSPDGTDFVSSTSLQAQHGLTGQHNNSHSEWIGDVLRAYGVQRGLQRVLSVVLAETMTGMLPPPAPTKQSASEGITITADSAAQHNAALRQAAAAALMAFGGAVSVRSPFCPSTLHNTTMTSLATVVGARDEVTAAEETQAGEEHIATGRVTSHDMAQAALTWQSHEETHAVNEEQQDDEEDDVGQSGARLRAGAAARLRACQALLRNNSDSVMLRKGRHTLQGNEEEEESALRGAADEDEDEDNEDDALAASMLGDGQGMLLLAHASTTAKKDGTALLSPAMSALRRGLGGPIASAALADMVLLSLTGMDLLEPNRVRDMHLHGLNAMQYSAAIKAQRAELERQRLLAQRGVEAIAPGRLLEHVANSTAVRQRGVQRLRRVSARARLERAAFSSVLRSYAAVVGRRVVTEATVRAAQALVARCLVQLPSALADSALDELLLQLREELHAEYALRHGGNTNSVELNDVVGLVESDDGVVGSVVNRMGSYYELTLQVLFASYATQAPMQERGSHALLLLDGHAAPRLAETASLLPSSSMALTTAANGNNEEVNGGGVHGSVAVLQSHTTLRLDTDNPVAFLHATDETHGMTTIDAAAASASSGAVKLELKQEVGMARLGATHKRPRPAGDNATHNRDVYRNENNTHDNSNSSSDDDNGDAARETFDFANDTMTRPSPYSHTLCRVLELLEAAKLNALLLDILLQAPALTRYVWAYLYKRFCLSSDKARCVIGLWLLTHLALKRCTTRSAAVNLLLQLSLSSREYVRRLAIRQLATLLAARGADGRAVMDRSAEAALVRYAVRQLATLPACTLSAAARKAASLINTTTSASQQHDNEAAMAENNTNTDSNEMEGGAALVERERHQLAELLNRYLGLFLMLCVRQPQQLMPSLLNVYKQCVEVNNTVMASLLPENGDVHRMTRHLLRSNTAAFMATVLPLLRRHAADARLLVQAMLRAMNEELRAMAQPEASPQEQQQKQKSDEESLRWVATTLLGHARAMYNAGTIPLQRPVVMSSQQQSLPPTTTNNNSSSVGGAMAGDVGGDAESATAAQLHDIRFVAPFLSFLPASELRRHYLRSFLYFVQVQLQFQRQYGQAMPTLSAKERSYVLTSAELKAFIKEVIREVVVRCAVKFNDGVVRGLSRVDFFVYLHRAPQESSSNNAMNSNSAMSDMTSGTTTTAVASVGYRVPPQHDATMAMGATMSSSGGTSSSSVFRAPVQLNSNNNTVIAPPVGMAQGVAHSTVGDERHYASHTSSLLPAPTSAAVMPVVKEEPHVHGGMDEAASLVTGNTTSAAQTMADAIALPPIGAVTTKEVIGVCLALTRSFDNTTTERLYGPQEVQKAIQKLLQQGPPLPSQLMATVLLAAALFARQRGNEFVRFVVYEVLPVLERTATWESDPRLWKGVLFFIEKYYRECSGFLVSLPDQVLMQALREQPQLCEYFKQEHGNNASFGHILGNL